MLHRFRRVSQLTPDGQLIRAPILHQCTPRISWSSLRISREQPDAFCQLLGGHGVFVQGKTERGLVKVHVRQVELAGLRGIQAGVTTSPMPCS